MRQEKNTARATFVSFLWSYLWSFIFPSRTLVNTNASLFIFVFSSIFSTNLMASSGSVNRSITACPIRTSDKGSSLDSKSTMNSW